MRIFGRGGTALPGFMAEKMYPKLLSKLVAGIPEGVVLITGTNGKTTSAKILRKLLESRNLKVLSNRSGSNFTRGILGTIIEHCDWRGRLDADIAVFEVDEAYARFVAKASNPKAMLVLNVMRDQLDRYGEIDVTARLISEAAKYCGGLVLNADDKPVIQIKNTLNDDKKTTTFGITENLLSLLPGDDELLGRNRKPQKSIVSADLKLIEWGQKQNNLTIEIESKLKLSADIRFEGIHNAQNALASLAVIHHLFGSVSVKDMESLSFVKPAFGRGESITYKDKKIHIALIKNPSGFNQNIRAFINNSVGTVLILINDRYADSRDVSWLWDVNLEPLKNIDAKYIAGGIRGYDMALRLQYEDIFGCNIEENIKKALDLAVVSTPNDKDILVLPTYTAMLEVRKILAKTIEMDEIWQ